MSDSALLDPLVSHVLLPIGRLAVSASPLAMRGLGRAGIGTIEQFWKRQTLRADDVMRALRDSVRRAIAMTESALAIEAGSVFSALVDAIAKSRIERDFAVSVRREHLRPFALQQGLLGENDDPNKVDAWRDFLRGALRDAKALRGATDAIVDVLDSDEKRLLNCVFTGVQTIDRDALVTSARKSLVIALNAHADVTPDRPLARLLMETNLLLSGIDYFFREAIKTDERLRGAMAIADHQTLASLDQAVNTGFVELRSLIEKGLVTADVLDRVEAASNFAREARDQLRSLDMRLTAFTVDFPVAMQSGFDDLAERAETILDALAKIDDRFARELESLREAQDSTYRAVESLAQDQAAGFAAVMGELRRMQVSAGDGYVSNPQTPQDHYRNARLAILLGDTNRAIAALEAFIDTGVPAMDAVAAYVTQLRFTRGPAAMQAEIAKRAQAAPDNPALQTAAAATETDPGRKLARLTEVIERFPDFVPAYPPFIEALVPTGSVPGAIELEHLRNAVEQVDALINDGRAGNYYVDPTQVGMLVAMRPTWDAWLRGYGHLNLETILAHDFEFRTDGGEVHVDVDLNIDFTITQVEYRINPTDSWTRIELENVERDNAQQILAAYPPGRYGMSDAMIEQMTLERRKGSVVWPSDVDPELRFGTRAGLWSRPIPYKLASSGIAQERAMRLRQEHCELMHPDYGTCTLMQPLNMPERIFKESDDPATRKVLVHIFQPYTEEDDSGIPKQTEIDPLDLLPGEIIDNGAVYKPVRVGNLADITDREYNVLERVLTSDRLSWMPKQIALKVIAQIGHPRYLPVINQLLNHENLLVREASAYAHSSILFQDQRPDGVRSLCDHLVESSDTEVRKAIVGKLAGSRDPQMIAPLVMVRGDIGRSAERLLDAFDFATVARALREPYAKAQSSSGFLQRGVDLLERAANAAPEQTGVSVSDDERFAAQVEFLLTYLDAEDLDIDVRYRDVVERLRALTSEDINDSAAWREWWVKRRKSLAVPVGAVGSAIEGAAPSQEDLRQLDERAAAAGRARQAQSTGPTTELRCPGCQKRYLIPQAPEALAGKRMTCKACGTKISCDEHRVG